MLDEGYGILPNKILFNPDLSSTAKLMYCYISSLCAKNGYCWAHNDALAEKMGISESQVKRVLSALKTYLDIRDGENHKRKIYLREPAHEVAQKRATSQRKNELAHNKINITSSNNTHAAIAAQVHAIHQLYLKQFIIPTKGLDTRYNDPAKMLQAAENRYKLSPTRRDLILRRLKDAGYNMICAAIVGYARDPFYVGENDRGWVASLDEYILRSYEKVEKGANMYEAQKRGTNAADPWANL